MLNPRRWPHADDGLNAYSLPELRLKAQASRTKGASVFAWDDGGGTLAVAAKRRLLLYHYDGLEFAPQRELSLADSVHCMRFAGGTLYVAMAKGCASARVHACSALGGVGWLLRGAPLALTPLPPWPARSECAAVEFASGVVSPLMGSRSSMPSTLTSVSPTEVLVTREGHSTLYGADGRPVRRGKGPSWAVPPLAIVTSGPYAVAVEVRGRGGRSAARTAC